MFNIVKRIFCKHDDEIVRKIKPFYNLRGEQTYKRCKKCGRIKEHIFMEYEGNGWK